MMKRLLIGLCLLALPALAQAQVIGLGSLTALNSAIAFNPGSVPVITFNVSGTYAGTVTFQCDSNGGGTYTSLLATNVADGSLASTTTATGNFAVPNPGCVSVQVKMTAYTSGTANISYTRGYWMAKSPFLPGPSYAPVTADCSAPSYSYSNDTNTGTTSVSAHSVSQCAWATEVTRATTTFFKSFLPVYLPDGTAAAPSFAPTSQTNTGMYFATNQFKWSAAGTDVMNVQVSGGLGLLTTDVIRLDQNNADVQLLRLGAGQALLRKDATHGIALDVATDGTLNCLSRAGADTCTVKANQLTATGTTTLATALTGILRADSGVVSVDSASANEVVGVAAGYKVARGVTALDGANPTTVATGLTTVVSCSASVVRTTALTSGTAEVTPGAISSANVDFYGWVLAGTASSGTENFNWICVGT